MQFDMLEREKQTGEDTLHAHRDILLLLGLGQNRGRVYEIPKDSRLVLEWRKTYRVYSHTSAGFAIAPEIKQSNLIYFGRNWSDFGRIIGKKATLSEA